MREPVLTGHATCAGVAAAGVAVAVEVAPVGLAGVCTLGAAVGALILSCGLDVTVLGTRKIDEKLFFFDRQPMHVLFDPARRLAVQRAVKE